MNTITYGHKVAGVGIEPIPPYSSLHTYRLNTQNNRDVHTENIVRDWLGHSTTEDRPTADVLVFGCWYYVATQLARHLQCLFTVVVLRYFVVLTRDPRVRQIRNEVCCFVFVRLFFSIFPPKEIPPGFSCLAGYLTKNWLNPSLGSLFLCLFLKTQPNHWTKQMVSTRLVTEDRRMYRTGGLEHYLVYDKPNQIPN